MSIGIFDLNIRQARKLGLALLCSATLSACVDGANGFSFAPKTMPSTDGAQEGPVIAKTTRATLALGSFVVTAPKGYCIDETSISNGLQSSSLMLAKCSSLDGKGAGADTTVMSVQISNRRGAGAVAPTATDLAQATAPRRVLQQKQKGALALVQVATGGNEVFSVADPVHWRGATLLDQRLVLLGLFAPKGSSMTSNTGSDALTKLAKGLSATRGSLLGNNSKAPDTSVEGNAIEQSEVASKIPAPDTVEPAKKGARGLIGRLLNRS
jgi:hypothetical protein